MPDFTFSLRAPLVGVWSLLVLGTAATAHSQEAALSGTWKLNPEKTAAERREVADPQTREGYASGGRPRVGTGVTEPRGGGGRTGGRAGDLGALSPYARSLPELVIIQSDTTVTLPDPSGMARTYWVDGRKESLQLPGVEPTELSARLRGGKLTIERKVGKAGAVREVYSLRGGGDELLVEVRLSGGDLAQPMDLKRVYDKSQPKI